MGERCDCDDRAIGPFADYCDGYARPGAEGLGYVSVLKVATATVEKSDDALLDGIVALDRAEAAGAYLGQINMQTASSFCGIAGQVWGHDLAVAEDIAGHHLTPLFSVIQHDGSDLPVYDGQPLLEAGQALFGTADARRYPPAPGAHVICANKSVTAYRPRADPLDVGVGQAYGVWCVLALSIARDRRVTADLFIEDAGVWTHNDREADLAAWLRGHRPRVAESIVACGRGQGLLFERTYLCTAHAIMPPGHLGIALAVAPYVVLARRALPDGDFAGLARLTLREWERRMGFTPAASGAASGRGRAEAAAARFMPTAR
ncbi:MAG: histidine decarboxylase, pyruvoyl type [Betaproteobacteria bacterium]|nr:histidine decarboxylase, pyruvoyl type [Betaproteobacteria bacterium]